MDSRVIELLEQLVPVKINAEKDIPTAKKYRVHSFPTILFVTAQGKRVDKIVGYLPPERFAAKVREILTVHRELSVMEAKFKLDPADLVTGGKLGAAYAGRGKASLAKKVIKLLEAADPNNDQGHLTNVYLAMGEYYLDEKERYQSAIRWYTKAVERGHEPAAVAVAHYRIGLAYFTQRTKHTKRSKKFGEKLRSAKEAIEALLAMSDIPEDLRLQADDLMQGIHKELTEHEKLRSKG